MHQLAGKAAQLGAELRQFQFQLLLNQTVALADLFQLLTQTLLAQVTGVEVEQQLAQLGAGLLVLARDLGERCRQRLRDGLEFLDDAVQLVAPVLEQAALQVIDLGLQLLNLTADLGEAQLVEPVLVGQDQQFKFQRLYAGRQHLCLGFTQLCPGVEQGGGQAAPGAGGGRW